MGIYKITQHVRRILIYGGAFSPPTLAHAAIMQACLELPNFDQLWVMPSGDRLGKTMELSDADRLEMLELVWVERFAKTPKLRISDFELRLPRPTQTASTILALGAAYPDTTFWFVFGTDSYASMPQWPDGAALQKRLQHIVLVGRGDRPASTAKHMLYLEIPQIFRNVSSTAVRRALRTGASLEGLLSKPVERYLKKLQVRYN